MHRQGWLEDWAAFHAAVMTREEICPTSIAPGLAMPHARLRGVRELSFAVARSSEPLVWFDEGSIRPKVVFLFAVPEAEARTYLSLVAAVGRLSKNPALIEQLRSASDGQSMFEVLSQAPLLPAGRTGMVAWPK